MDSVAQTSSSEALFASKLLCYDAFQIPDSIDKEMEADFEELSRIMADRSELEINSDLQKLVAQSNGRQQNIMSGLLFGILTDNKRAPEYFRLMAFCNRDNYAHVVSRLKHATLVWYQKLQDQVQFQLIWIIEKLIENSAPQADVLLLNLLRNIKASDLNDSNIWLAEALLGILNDRREWMLQFHGLVSTSVYVFLRLIVDHTKMPEMLNAEVKYCVSLIREKYSECSLIGRDLVRLLKEASFFSSDIAVLLENIQSDPSSIAGCTGIESLLAIPTPKHFFQWRLAHELEANLLFILEKVEWGRNDDLYLQWFIDLHTLNVDNPSQMSDIIRYIVAHFHPSNELLQSKIIPRYAFIGKLLKAFKGNIPSVLKQALLFDWIFYVPGKDSIMNIEPAVLLMDRSVDKYSEITLWILDYLDHLAISFLPPLSNLFREHINLAMNDALKKRVISSLDHLLNSPGLDETRRQIAKKLFTGTPTTNSLPTSTYPSRTSSLVTSPIDVEKAGEKSLWMLGDFPETLKAAIHNGNLEEAEIVLEEIFAITKSMNVPLLELAEILSPISCLRDGFGEPNLINMLLKRYDDDSDRDIVQELLTAMKSMKGSSDIIGPKILMHVVNSANPAASYQLYKTICEKSKMDTNITLGKDLKALSMLLSLYFQKL